VLVVSLGTTGGWRAAAAELVGSLERAGASVALVQPGPARRMRTFALTDLAQALATRAAARSPLRFSGRREGRSGSTPWPRRIARAGTAPGSVPSSAAGSPRP
jgi:hypothetical protein